MQKHKIDLGYAASLLLSIALAFLIGALILTVSGHAPLNAYTEMVKGSLSNARHIGDTLEYAMVLCICGLACAVGSRAGIFNVGGEGQLLLGAVVAAQVGVAMEGSPKIVVIVCAALAAMAMGGAYAFVPGVLKVKLKVNEVITTIMLNTVAIYICQYLAKGPWRNSNPNIIAGTENLAQGYWLARPIAGSKLSSAIFASAVIAFLVWYIMQKTSVGYEMRLTGQNPRFARFAGLKTDTIVILAMLVSGAMCGAVGMFRVYGAEHIFKSSISNEYYFDGMMVAMITQYNPAGIILMSLFFAFLKIGAAGMEANAGVPNQIYLILQTVIIFFMAAQRGIAASVRAAAAKRTAQKEARARLAEGGARNG